MIPRALEFTTPPDEPVIRFRRFFKAPPALVFETWTDPGHRRDWWGPRMLELVVCEVDLGGSYRYVLRAPDGQERGLHGEYREIDTPHRLASTFVLEVAPGNEAVETSRPRRSTTARWSPAQRSTSPSKAVTNNRLAAGWRRVWPTSTCGWTSCWSHGKPPEIECASACPTSRLMAFEPWHRLPESQRITPDGAHP